MVWGERKTVLFTVNFELKTQNVALDMPNRIKLYLDSVIFQECFK